MFKTLFIVLIVAAALSSCRGNDGKSAAPPVMQSDTVGFSYNYVSTRTDGEAIITEVLYKVYCTDRGIPGATIWKEIGQVNPYYWRDLMLPWDGNWWCGITARTNDTDESGMTPWIGVNKQGDLYFKIP